MLCPIVYSLNARQLYHIGRVRGTTLGGEVPPEENTPQKSPPVENAPRTSRGAFSTGDWLLLFIFFFKCGDIDCRRYHDS